MSTHEIGGTVGLWTGALEGQPPTKLGEVAAQVEALGYGSLWFGEAWGREALTQATLLLAGTSRLVVGTGIANIYARDAAAATNGGRLLAGAFANRFVLGLGVSHKPLVERMRGHEYASPIETMAAYLEAMNDVPYMSAGPSDPAPRVIAALGPKMLKLAATASDGAHPYLVTPDHTATARDTMGQGPLLIVEQAVALTDDEDEFVRRAHEHLNIYTGLPNYRNSWKRQGFTDEDFGRGGSRRLKDGMVVWGDEAKVKARVQEHLDAGADQVLLQVLGADLNDLPLDDWTRLAAALVG
jgi:probable F420-dependent oxidoreductase